MKNKLKIGFTLAEILLVLAIISILIVAAMLIANPKHLSTRYMYSNTLAALDKAFFNAYSVDGIDPFADTYTDSNKVEQEMVKSDEQDDGAWQLCLGLTRYINTVMRPEETCSPYKLVNYVASDAEFTPNRVQFTAHNGVKFYITRELGEGTHFYLIFADLNGEKGPNTVWYATVGDHHRETGAVLTKQHDPDIFAFAVLPIGRVIPIGPPEYNPSYLLTRVTYMNNMGETAFSAVSQPYYLSKAVAWGYYTNVPGAPPKDINAPDSIEDEHTWNDYIRSQISDSWVLVNFDMPEIKSTETQHHVNEGKDYSDTTGYRCALNEFDECGINIDRYTY